MLKVIFKTRSWVYSRVGTANLKLLKLSKVRLITCRFTVFISYKYDMIHIKVALVFACVQTKRLF